MPLRNTVVFPHQVIPLAVGREKSLNLLKLVDEESKIIGLVSQKDGNLEEPKGEDLYVAFGNTNAGRHLTVLFVKKKNSRSLVISARDMSKKERKRYGKK